MKNILLLILTIVVLSSCKKTYQCTCPSLLMGPQPYVFEVKATNKNKATDECIKAGKDDDLVSGDDYMQCRLYEQPQ